MLGGRSEGMVMLTIQMQIGREAAMKILLAKTNRQKQTSITTNTSASRSNESVQNQNRCSRKAVVVRSHALCSCKEVDRGGLLLLEGLKLGERKLRAASREDIGRQCKKICHLNGTVPSSRDRHLVLFRY